jgi:hypothetical protein
MSLEFSEHGSRVFTGKVKPDFGFKFVNKDNVKQVEAKLEKMGINKKQGQE